MTTIEIKERIIESIEEVAKSQKIKLPLLNENHAIVDDLGFTSLAIMKLISRLDEVFGVDPFEDESVMATDMRTVADLCAVYANCMAKSDA